MSILTIGWSIVVTASLILAFQHFIIWLNDRNSKANILFTLSALGASFSAVLELLQLHSASIEAYNLYVRIGHIPIFVLLVSLVWFIDIYFGTARRWLTILITSLWSIALIFNFYSENNLVFQTITELKRTTLPWGETFSIPIGVTNPLKYIADAASILILIFVSDASYKLWKKGNKRRASIVGGSIILFILFAGIHTPLVDDGVIETPYLVSFAFLGIIIAMSLELLNDVLSIPFLSNKVLSQEIRWKSLLNNMSVAVIEVDAYGKIIYANPFYVQFFGHSEDEIIGKHYSDLLSNNIKEELLKISKTVRGKDEIPPFQLKMKGTDSELKVINWNVVRINDAENNFISTLSVGMDITEHNKALIEIKQLKERLEKENIILREEILHVPEDHEILGSSDTLRYSLNRVKQVAETDTIVLLEGETGVGKDLFANLIHKESKRNNKPFIKVNCAVIPSNLIESELFGHEKGAFTGADSKRIGRFENADGATIFLDEIGELPLELQPKLLRIVEEGEFERLGSNRTIKVDVRIITATNRILKEEIEKKTFREDLYYRLSAFPISIPSLRQRKEDIPILVESFVSEFARKLGKEISQISNSTMEYLKNYDWPGNIRELRNIIERAVISSDSSILKLSDKLADDNNSTKEYKSFQEFESSYIKEVLESCNWKIEGPGGAAEKLELHPNTLRSKIKKHGIIK